MPGLPINNERALLLRVAQGDENAFGQLFKTYYNQLGDFVIRITESETIAQEIVQDVFLKIWTNRHLLRDVHCFKAYLMVVARNYTFNCLKQIARENFRKKEWLNNVLASASQSTEDTTDPQMIDLIDRAVELLPPQQKRVYILSRREKMKQEEIAKALGVSLETVKKHMVLALRFLKNHLRTHIDLLIFCLIYFI